MKNSRASTTWRTALPVALAMMLPPALCVAAESRLLLTHPQATWSLRIGLPGFDIKAPMIFRDRSQVWAGAEDHESGVILTVYIEKVAEAVDAGSCRKYYLKKLKDLHAKVATSERKEMAIAEFMLPRRGDTTGDQKTLHAYLYHDGFCVDLHLSKPQFREDQEKLFTSVLDAVTLGPATEDERAGAAGYVPSSGPREELIVGAVQKLRAKGFTAADALLSPLCPWETETISDKEKADSAECSLRTAGAAEGHGLKGAKEVASMYRRAAEMVQKEGEFRAAEATYKKSLDLDPGEPQTWYALGHLYRHEDELDMALSAFRSALELRPGEETAMYWISTTLMDQGRLDDADAMLDQALGVDPKDGRIWFRKGQLEMKRRDFHMAIEDFEKARSLGVDAKVVRQRIEECEAAQSRK